MAAAGVAAMEAAMFERFTDRARRVVVLAQEEARVLNHNYIGTEHILLGLIHEGEGVAAKALKGLGISLEAVRQQVEEIIGVGKHTPSGHIPFTPRAKKVLELSLRESLQLGHNYIGTEHILLGLLREGEGVAAQALVRLGADLNRVRQQVIQLLHGYQGKEPEGLSVSARRARLGASFSREDEFLLLLGDITARLRTVEEHLGIRRSTEAEPAGHGTAAEPGEAEPGEAGPGGVESGAGDPGQAESREAARGAEESGRAASGAAGPGQAESSEAARGGKESGEAGPGDQSGHVPG
jgi:hypothetical protein